ncbi:cation:proton antiporter [Streptomyces monticola]|uniref:Cation:proton antiporter n=1 Tax=Streptomyces monticola TaxID=2666263 RepID=A0ABW2JZ26_9ACTN
MPFAAPIPPLPAHQLFVFLLQAGLLILLALLCGRLAARFGMPAVAGELCVGVLLGPTVLGSAAPQLSQWLLPPTTDQFHLLDALGQIGVVLLVGVTGMEMDVGLIRRRGATALSVGLGGLLLPLGLGVAAGYAAPGSLIPAGIGRPAFALFIGVALCVSALPVIAKTLTDMNLLHRNVGQLTLAAGMVDDIIGWILLSVVTAMAMGDARPESVALLIGATVLVLAATALVGRPLVRRVLRATERSEPGITVAAATALILLSAAATHALGLEAMFGAFLAGMLIGSVAGSGAGSVAGSSSGDGSGSRPEPAAGSGSRGASGDVSGAGSGAVPVLARLAPLRTVVLAVFAPLFFATAGLRIDLTALADPPVLAAAVVLLLVAVVGKVAGAFAGARIGRLGPWESLALGGALNARGVIQLVIATVGLRIGVLTTTTYTLIVLVAIATSLMAPPILRFAMRRVEQTAEEELRRRERTFLPLHPTEAPADPNP